MYFKNDYIEKGIWDRVKDKWVKYLPLKHINPNPKNHTEKAGDGPAYL